MTEHPNLPTTTADKNDRREIFGWLTYDWANSAFYTTVVSVLLGPYLTSLAQTHVGDNGTILSLGALGSVTAKNLFSVAIGVSVFLQITLLPVPVAGSRMSTPLSLRDLPKCFSRSQSVESIINLTISFGV